MPTDNKRLFGAQGEKVAIEYLSSKGYRILDTNFRAGKIGEIDIIALKDEFICFIEVKTRTGSLFGTPAEAVGIKKQLNIIRLAKIYISSRKLYNSNIRFDIVEITGKRKDNILFTENINLIENAF